jgi:hypothetical protein
MELGSPEYISLNKEFVNFQNTRNDLVQQRATGFMGGPTSAPVPLTEEAIEVLRSQGTPEEEIRAHQSRAGGVYTPAASGLTEEEKAATPEGGAPIPQQDTTLPVSPPEFEGGILQRTRTALDTKEASSATLLQSVTPASMTAVELQTFINEHRTELTTSDLTTLTEILNSKF